MAFWWVCPGGGWLSSGWWVGVSKVSTTTRLAEFLEVEKLDAPVAGVNRWTPVGVWMLFELGRMGLGAARIPGGSVCASRHRQIYFSLQLMELHTPPPKFLLSKGPPDLVRSFAFPLCIPLSISSNLFHATPSFSPAFRKRYPVP